MCLSVDEGDFLSCLGGGGLRIRVRDGKTRFVGPINKDPRAWAEAIGDQIAGESPSGE
jgi:hypothetical protein